MRKSRKICQESTPRIIEQDPRNSENPAWWIEYTPGEPDYFSYIADRGFIGARRTQSMARDLIDSYRIPEAS